jgi:PAP2 superfamily
MKYDSTPECTDLTIPENSKSGPTDQDQNFNCQKEIKLQSRRRFLSAAGGITTATLALTGSSVMIAEAQDDDDDDDSSAQERRVRALEIRREAAFNQLQMQFPEALNNGDEDRFPRRFASYSKGLPHNNLGEADRNAYQKLLFALSNDDPSSYDAIPLGGSIRLANPQASVAFDMEGVDSNSLSVSTPPSFASEAFAGEVAELYWRALTRDIPFSQYGDEQFTRAAIEDLNRFSGYQDVNSENIFRGQFPGDQTGPYISQFLLQPYIVGSTPVRQLYRTTVAGDDHMTAYQTWLDIQNGNPPSSSATFDSRLRYIRNGRDMTEWAHSDYSFQGFVVAALILLGYGPAALDDANPYKGVSSQSGFTTFGSPHVLDLVARVANQALKASWYQKWKVHRRIRPEEFSGRIHNLMTGKARYPINEKLLNSPALAAIFRKNGTYLLPQAYPEGCPCHPAFTGGHATIAGACVTVLKAFFNESFVIPNAVVASDNGLLLQEYRGAPLTIGNELNKLASNISFGRDTAGIHYRSDEIEGLRLGEAVAISVLTDFNATYNENFAGFSLTKFDGTTVTLDAFIRAYSSSEDTYIAESRALHSEVPSEARRSRRGRKRKR